MNTFAELLALLKTVFADEISLQGITEQTPLNTLGISSVGYLYLALAVEERFGVRFPLWVTWYAALSRGTRNDLSPGTTE